jgi:hypothetical protein
MFERDWIYRKIFVTIAELNGFYRTLRKTDDEYGLPNSRTPEMEKQTHRIQDELRKIADQDPHLQQAALRALASTETESQDFRVRIAAVSKKDRRSQANPTKKLMYPEIEWDMRLDVRQDETILNLWSQMADKGWVSPRSVVQGAGLDWDSEQATFSADAHEIVRNMAIMQAAGNTGGPGGGAGAMLGAMNAASPPTDDGVGAEVGEGTGAPGSNDGLSARTQSREEFAREVTATVGVTKDEILNDVDYIDRNRDTTDFFTRA